MKQITLLALLVGVSFTAMTHAARAEDDWRKGLYVKGAAGVTFSANQNYDTSLGKAKVEPDTGGVGTVAIGKDLGNSFRVEAEGSYRRADIDKATIATTNLTDVDGKTEVSAGMINAYYDFHNTSAFTPYVGAGAGVAHIRSDKYQSGPATFANGSDNVFAYQAMVGTEYKFNEDFSASLEYRYFEADNVNINDTLGGSGGQNYDYKNHAIMAGLRYNLK